MREDSSLHLLTAAPNCPPVARSDVTLSVAKAFHVLKFDFEMTVKYNPHYLRSDYLDEEKITCNICILLSSLESQTLEERMTVCCVLLLFFVPSSPFRVHGGPNAICF